MKNVFKNGQLYRIANDRSKGNKIQSGESIKEWSDRLKSKNKYGIYGGEITPSYITVDRPDQKPTGNWFQRIKKFRYPYGKPIDVMNVWNNEETQLALETLDKKALRSPKNAEDIYNKVSNFKTYDVTRDNLERRVDEYRGNYASSILPFKRNSNSNDILSQLWRYYSRKKGYNHITSNNNKVNFSNKGTDIIDLDKNVIRLTPDSRQSTALFNEFVETKNPSVRTAGEYQSGNIKSLSDRNIPFDNISLYAGIEDGHYKVDSLYNFNPKTTVYPVRNVKKSILPITAIKIKDVEEKIPTEDDGKTYFWNNLRRNIDPYWYSRRELDENYHLTVEPKDWNPELEAKRQAYRDMAASKIDSLLNIGQRKKAYKLITGSNNNSTLPTSWIRKWNDYYRNAFNANYDYYELPELLANRDSLETILQNIPVQTNDTGKGLRYFYIDTEGQEHPISEYNASILDSKMVFGNPQGGKFIGRIQDISSEQLNALNKWLSENPSWLVRPDLGSFSQYRLDNPSLKEYLTQYFEHPKPEDPNVYTVGTVEPNKIWNKEQGGIIKGQNSVKLSKIQHEPPKSLVPVKQVQKSTQSVPLQPKSTFEEKFKSIILRMKQTTQRPKAIGVYSFGYKQPTKVVEDGGNMS